MFTVRGQARERVAQRGWDAPSLEVSQSPLDASQSPLDAALSTLRYLIPRDGVTLLPLPCTAATFPHSAIRQIQGNETRHELKVPTAPGTEAAEFHTLDILQHVYKYYFN